MYCLSRRGVRRGIRSRVGILLGDQQQFVIRKEETMKRALCMLAAFVQFAFIGVSDGANTDLSLKVITSDMAPRR